MKKYVKATDAADLISKRTGIPIGDLVDIFADIPDILRCKDCAFLVEEKCSYHSNEKVDLFCDPDDYCSAARRRTNNVIKFE